MYAGVIPAELLVYVTYVYITSMHITNNHANPVYINKSIYAHDFYN